MNQYAAERKISDNLGEGTAMSMRSSKLLGIAAGTVFVVGASFASSALAQTMGEYAGTLSHNVGTTLPAPKLDNIPLGAPQASAGQGSTRSIVIDSSDEPDYRNRKDSKPDPDDKATDDWTQVK
jgi:hypothetical protein